MAGPYNIPTVSYNGTDPDPVEWANENVKPAIEDLDARVSAVPRIYPIAGIVGVGSWSSAFVAPNGTTTSQIAGVMVGIPFIPDRNFTADRIAIEVMTAGSGGGTCALSLYNPSSLPGIPGTWLATLGSVAVDSTGIKELTINRSFQGGELVWIVATPSVSFTARAFDGERFYPPLPGDQGESLSPSYNRVFPEWNGGTNGSTWVGTGTNLRQFSAAFRRSA